MPSILEHLPSQRGKTSIVALLGLILVIVFGIAFFGDKLPFIKQSNYKVLAPSPNPAISTTATYTNNELGIKFDYPRSWQVQEITSKNEKILQSILQITPQGFKGDIPPIKLFYIPNPNNLSLEALENTLNPKNQGIPIVYSPDDTYNLSGAGLIAYFRSPANCVTVKCQIYTFNQDKRAYQLVNFVDVNADKQSATFNQVFNTLRFTQPQPTKSPDTSGY